MTVEERLRVNEIFFSIQGESSHSGRPCAFVRLTGCNLRCVYCDTTYAFQEGTWMTVEEVIDRVLKYPTSLVEITGGEPLLQEPVYRLSEQLLENGKEVMIETGGSLDITRVDPRVVLVHDLKCPDSGMLEHNRWENLKHLRRHDEIKFVISSRTDYEWARQVVIKQALPSRHVVLFSPAWQLLEPTLLARWILSDGLPVRLQVQLHKILWGEQRGV